MDVVKCCAAERVILKSCKDNASTLAAGPPVQRCRISRGFRNRTAIVKIDVARLTGFIGDHAKVDDIRAGWNACCSECSLLAVIVGFGWAFPCPELNATVLQCSQTIPYWHIPIMLRSPNLHITSVIDLAGVALSAIVFPSRHSLPNPKDPSRLVF